MLSAYRTSFRHSREMLENMEKASGFDPQNPGALLHDSLALFNLTDFDKPPMQGFGVGSCSGDTGHLRQ